MNPRFTLETGRWYAAEVVGEEFLEPEGFRGHSPIKIYEIQDRSNGHQLFELSFYHAHYPTGGKQKVHSLETVEHSQRFLLARSTTHTPTRLWLMYEISWPWLSKHLGIKRPLDEDVQRWLAQHV